MEYVRIYDTDEWDITAVKIYDGFKLEQNCKVEGFVEITPEIQRKFKTKYGKEDIGNIEKKGELVLLELKRLYHDQYFRVGTSGRIREATKRKRKNEIGGSHARVMFKFKWSLVTEHKVTIWRIQ